MPLAGQFGDARDCTTRALRRALKAPPTITGWTIREGLLPQNSCRRFSNRRRILTFPRGSRVAGLDQHLLALGSTFLLLRQERAQTPGGPGDEIEVRQPPSRIEVAPKPPESNGHEPGTERCRALGSQADGGFHCHCLRHALAQSQVQRLGLKSKRAVTRSIGKRTKKTKVTLHLVRAAR